MEEILCQLADSFLDSTSSPSHRALLYLKGKREDLIVNALSETLIKLDDTRRISTEYGLRSDEITAWNSTLKSRGYFSGSSGLKREKIHGRVDLTCLDPADLPVELIEVKAWSATDAVDESRYLDSKQYNHSLLKSFEIDALKMQAVNVAKNATNMIVTAVFTVHCDDLSIQQMTEKGLSYVSLLNKQNSDKARIGSSDDYRLAGVNQIMNQFNAKFGSGTELNAKFTHVYAFNRNQAFLDGVGLSLDLIGAEFKHLSN